MSAFQFDASGVPPATGELDPIPAGWYDIAMDQSEMKPTKDHANTRNEFLEFRFNVISGQYAGRKLYARLNVRNSNPVAAEIAAKELSAICHATGILKLDDTQQLHGIPMKAKVKVKGAEGQYSASNEITTFKPANFVPDAPAGAVPAGARPPMAGGVPVPGAMLPQQQVWQQPQPPAAGVPQQPWQQPQPPQPPQFQQPMPGQPPQQPWQQPAQAPQQGQPVHYPQQPGQPPQPPAFAMPGQPQFQQPMPPQQPQQPPAQPMQPQPWANPTAGVTPWGAPAGGPPQA